MVVLFLSLLLFIAHIFFYFKITPKNTFPNQKKAMASMSKMYREMINTRHGVSTSKNTLNIRFHLYYFAE